jgi:hypothetical protein
MHAALSAQSIPLLRGTCLHTMQPEMRTSVAQENVGPKYGKHAIST